MDDLSYDVVDVFTDRAFAGNPLAVVHGTAGMSDGQLLSLAREFNLSETAFPWPVTGGMAADYRLRICTPAVELPFAGHPSVGAAWVLRSRGVLGAGASSVVQECGAGLLPLRFDGDDVVLTGGRPEVGPELDAEAVAAAVGLRAADVVVAPRTAGTGLAFTYLVVGSPEVVDACAPVAALLSAFGPGGISVSAVSGSQAYTRVFAGGVGVDEDPATGSAALGFGVFAAAAGMVDDGGATLTVTQGVRMGRPSTLLVTVDATAGAATTVSVRGSVVPVASGTIRRPDADSP